MIILDDSLLFGVVACAGFVYGYCLYGTPLLPRAALRWFIPMAGTSMIAYSLLRNSGDAAAPWERVLPCIVWNLMLVGGARLRSHIELRYSWPDLFDHDIAPKPARKDRHE